jgi:hypothetical protein
MISQESPFKNIPRNLDRKQAFFIDGIRHAAEICDLSYKRLTAGLWDIALKPDGSPLEPSYATFFLDAWAFVDAADRLRCLWASQPNADNLSCEFSPEILRQELGPIRKVRNIADHIAQRADHVVSLNGAALGILAWVAIISETPLAAKTCIIRPGYASGSFSAHFAIPQGTHSLINSCTEVRVHAGDETADLTKAYRKIAQVIAFAESYLKMEFSKPIYAPPSVADLLATADLNFEHTGITT